MIGNLTVDKASLNISYFLKSIKIIADNGGSISRGDFVDEMADFMGTCAVRDGKENRTPYNKLKQVQYFGFSYIERTNEGSLLCLTRRGLILSSLICENFSEEDPEKRYYISDENICHVRRLFIYDILYNSYGRNNCGAEQSKTDTEPPKVIVRLLSEIGKATCDEICYAIYALNGGKYGNATKILEWDKIIETIKNKRISGDNFSKIFEQWEITNIVQDFKIVNLLANPNVDVIRQYNDGFEISPCVENQYLEAFRGLPYYYKPQMNIFINKQNKLEDVKTWVLDAVINKDESSKDLCVCDVRNNDSIIDDINNIVIKAFSNQKRNTYLLVIANNKEQFFNSFGLYKDLLNRLEDVTSYYNGESLSQINGHIFHKLPSNLHIVCIVINN